MLPFLLAKYRRKGGKKVSLEKSLSLSNTIEKFAKSDVILKYRSEFKIF